MAETKLTPKTQAIILASVREHGFKTVACAAAGISRTTITNWEKRGAEGEEPYSSFLEELEKAKADRIERGLKTVRDAAKDDYKAETWALSHIDSEQFGQKTKTELSGPGGTGIAIVFEGMDADKGDDD